ncbi:uncharacterized protein K460DRAFT_404993 [Cucurbitaria berberidis CBS 394.84]|uniref:USP domain-containing protein n=1 Tax=Cucurbitaria berberidis CBS 394.84 TaxID=1168544 RepID=A0A9P4GFK5_9PLEO|nr:uncharacterized protein K460DRAFT_404993 [Cucurbitaria berberidis CBS 394.84]KAF1844712.1 hypothetical protein K460DRAFT_404993 [Cucurbitaria berberidis CBS 394.84]
MPANRVTRSQARTGEPLFAQKTDLQRQRDHYGQSLKTKWLPQGLRLHQDPRGIHIGTHNDRSLQNVVYQSLMHLPIFLNWIKSHNEHCTATNCTLCALKALVREYWGPHNINTPFPDTHMALTQIANSASAQHALQDAYNFYEWITARVQMGDPNNLMANDPQNPWDNELRALFQLDVSQDNDCQSCNRSFLTSEQYGIINANFDMYLHMNVDDIVNHWFGQDRGVQHCPTCGSVEDFTYTRRIEAAPQVLRIKVNLNATLAGLLTKQGVPFDVPELLDLTQYQENGQLPLEYTLSSAISHGGLGVAQEVAWDLFSPTPSDHEGVLGPDEYEEEDEDEDEDENEDEEEEEDDDEDEEELNFDDFPTIDQNMLDLDQQEEDDETEDEDLNDDLSIHDNDDDEREETPPYQTISRWAYPGAPRRTWTAQQIDLADYNGLIEVTREEFINELGPGSSQPSSDIDEAEDHDGEDALYRRSSISGETDSQATMSEAPSNIGGAPWVADFLAAFPVLGPVRRFYNWASGCNNNNNPPPNAFGQGPVQDFLSAMNGNIIGNSSGPTQLNRDLDNEFGVVDLTEDWDSDESGDSVHAEHWIVNTRGPDNEFHISDAHFETLGAGQLNANPQAPQAPDPCDIPHGYQVYILTYTRNKLRGRAGKMERNIPAFI